MENHNQFWNSVKLKCSQFPKRLVRGLAIKTVFTYFQIDNHCPLQSTIFTRCSNSSKRLHNLFSVFWTHTIFDNSPKSQDTKSGKWGGRSDFAACFLYYWNYFLVNNEFFFTFFATTVLIGLLFDLKRSFTVMKK